MLQTICVPHGLDAAHQALASAMVKSRRALQTFFKEARRLYQALHDLEELGARGPVVLVGLILSGRLFELLMDSRRTLHQRLETIFGDDEIPKFVLGAPIAYFDDDPSKLSYLLYLGVWTRYVQSGSYYFKVDSSALTAPRQARAGSRRRRTVLSEVRSIVADPAQCIRRNLRRRGHPARSTRADRARQRFPSAIAEMLPAGLVLSSPNNMSGSAVDLVVYGGVRPTRPAADFGVSAIRPSSIPIP
jgi:hypothetical protein